MIPHASPPTRRLPGWCLVLAGVVLVAITWRVMGRRTVDPLIATPRLALEAMSGSAIYFNAGALPWLRALRPELLPEAARDPQGVIAIGYARAVQAPKLFRQLDRQARFDTLLLVGNPSEFRPLIEHLVETKDFVPVYVDHWAIILKRAAAKPWEPAQLDALRAWLAGANVRERAAALAETAVRLAALRRVEDARALLAEAEQLDGRSAAMWNGRAVLHSQRGEWKEALACADRALGGKKEPLAAVATKAQALYAMKEFSAAYDLSAYLVERVPDDPGILFYHAKIAHDAHAYKAEIAALEKLIALATEAHWPTSGYHIYLGQAYASVSDGKRAVAAFATALEDDELPKEQRDFANENIRRIKSRVSIE